MRRTKIICTIGPACDNVEILKEMLPSMDIARLNFSHGSRELHLQSIHRLREAAGDFGKKLAILLDIKGPKIRLGKLEHEPVRLVTGQTVILTGNGDDENQTPDNSSEEPYLRLPVSYKMMAGDVKAGDKVLLADGLVALTVKKTCGYNIYCTVDDGGEISSGKGINIPGITISLPSLTEKDKLDIRFGVEQEVDFIAASFVRTAADVIAVREVIEKAGGNQDVIAKIESSRAVENLDEIIRASDGIMVARGDLGVEIPPEDVPIIQKKIIESCNEAGKPVITATQMLESMIYNPRPTRAEASDVANAILDGTDAVMLSGETAVGKYPVETVKTMARIAKRADEAFKSKWPMGRIINKSMHTATDSIGRSTCTISYNLNAAAVITSTQTGYTAKMVARYRPPVPVIAVTPKREVLRKLALVWGVQSFLVQETNDTDSMIESAVAASLAAEAIKPGDLVIITAGVPVGVHGSTNLLKIQTVGEVLLRGTGIGKKAAAGRVKIVRNSNEALDKVEDGDILVAMYTDAGYIPAIKKAAAIITEEGGLTSHAAVVGIEFRIPVVVNVEGALRELKDNQIVTVDAQRGLIYTGEARVY